MLKRISPLPHGCGCEKQPSPRLMQEIYYLQVPATSATDQDGTFRLAARVAPSPDPCRATLIRLTVRPTLQQKEVHFPLTNCYCIDVCGIPHIHLSKQKPRPLSPWSRLYRVCVGTVQFIHRTTMEFKEKAWCRYWMQSATQPHGDQPHGERRVRCFLQCDGRH